MRHLTPATYTRQPWANGRGVTTEILRQEQDGLLHLRLSMATVTEDGPFSIFPGIERNLTVIAGAGFVLRGPGLLLHCPPLIPVAFAGDVAVTATGTQGQPSEDFNVLTDRRLPRPQVVVLHGAATLNEGGTLHLLALGPASVNGTAIARHDLITLTGPARVNAAAGLIVVRVGSCDGQARLS